MAADDSGKQPSFKVQDRRRFSATGEAREVEDERREVEDERRESEATRPETAGANAAPRAAGEEAARAIEPPGTDADAAAMGAQPGPEITFASFVLSLSTQALVHLGEMPDPLDGRAQVNLEGARQIIDILAVLREKTRGNLDAAEGSLIESALYDLRMRYVDRVRHR